MTVHRCICFIIFTDSQATLKSLNCLQINTKRVSVPKFRATQDTLKSVFSSFKGLHRLLGWTKTQKKFYLSLVPRPRTPAALYLIDVLWWLFISMYKIRSLFYLLLKVGCSSLLFSCNFIQSQMQQSLFLLRDDIYVAHLLIKSPG